MSRGPHSRWGTRLPRIYPYQWKNEEWKLRYCASNKQKEAKDETADSETVVEMEYAQIGERNLQGA